MMPRSLLRGGFNLHEYDSPQFAAGRLQRASRLYRTVYPCAVAVGKRVRDTAFILIFARMKRSVHIEKRWRKLRKNNPEKNQAMSL
jgi:hypothetical protein